MSAGLFLPELPLSIQTPSSENKRGRLPDDWMAFSYTSTLPRLSLPVLISPFSPLALSLDRDANRHWSVKINSRKTFIQA